MGNSSYTYKFITKRPDGRPLYGSLEKFQQVQINAKWITLQSVIFNRNNITINFLIPLKR